MFYFILVVLLAVMITMGLRAEQLNLIIKDSVGVSSEEQVAVWHEMGGFNILLLTYGASAFQNFIAGAGVVAAYIGLWRIALGHWSGLVIVLIGLVVCGLIQLGMISRIKKYFSEYEQEYGESPEKYLTGKNSLAYAVYASVMIGIGKAVKWILICSVVGISIFWIFRSMARGMLNMEEKIIRGDFDGFPPNIIYDEAENPWRCTDVIGDDQDIRVYTKVSPENALDVNLKIYVDTKQLEGHENVTGIRVGNREFHWSN